MKARVSATGMRMFVGLRECEARSNPSIIRMIASNKREHEGARKRDEIASALSRRSRMSVQDCGSAKHEAIRLSLPLKKFQQLFVNLRDRLNAFNLTVYGKLRYLIFVIYRFEQQIDAHFGQRHTV